MTNHVTRPGRLDGLEREALKLEQGRVSYFVGGSGKPVILLHGASLDNGSITWRHVAEDLVKDHRVYSPDLPKHGASWPWAARADQYGLESTVLSMMDAWRVPSATLVGLSMGAAVALGVALNNEDRVSGLVLASCGGIQHRVNAHELSYLSLRRPVSWALSRMQSGASLSKFARTLPYSDDVTEDDVDLIASAYLAEYMSKRRNRGHLFSDWNRYEIGPHQMRTNLMPRLNELKCPALFLHGRDDSAVPVDLAIEAAARAPQGRAEIIEGAGHFLPQDHPAETVAIVRRFLTEIGQ